MNVSYALTRDDFAVAHAETARYLRAQARAPHWLALLSNVALWAVIGFSLSMLFDAMKGLPSSRYNSLLMAVGGLVAALIAMAVARVYVNRRLCARAIDLLGPLPLESMLSVEEAGLRSESRLGEWTHPFGQVVAVRDLAAHLTVIMRPGYVLTIPKQAFGSDEAMREFQAEIARRSSLTTH